MCGENLITEELETDRKEPSPSQPGCESTVAPKKDVTTNTDLEARAETYGSGELGALCGWSCYKFVCISLLIVNCVFMISRGSNSRFMEP
mmetsp:Transcript_37937/g.59191  ORF Transcript_37937/g.59191 Transcript_37937/m.59191 type:complete len:90 (-) Transcript_37937:294-563(-)